MLTTILLVLEVLCFTATCEKWEQELELELEQVLTLILLCVDWMDTISVECLVFTNVMKNRLVKMEFILLQSDQIN